MKRRALLSVSDKTAIVEFARGLVTRDFEIISTGGTARKLADACVPVTKVEQVTGFPEMMEGRLKTIHPLIAGGILGRPDVSGDVEAMKTHGIKLFDIVVVNLYQFAKTAADPEKTFDELIEDIDIGGPSLVRAAAKNFKHVLVVTDPEDYSRVLRVLELPSIPMEFRFHLARKAMMTTAEFDTAVVKELIYGVRVVNGVCERIPCPQMHDGTI